MAVRTIRVMTDDLDGTESEDIETYYFGVNGKVIEIDLTPDNAAAMMEDFQRWMDAGRETTRKSLPAVEEAGPGTTSIGRGGASKKKPASSPEHNRAVREWLKNEGYTCPPRGRIPAELMEVFDQAHKSGSKKLASVG